MSETLYKVLGARGQAIHGGSCDWFLPKNGKPGKWMPKIEDPKCCVAGYHLVELSSLVEWLRDGCTIYEAQGKGPSHSDGSGKTAFAQARLVRQLHISEEDLRLFAADCAEHVLPLFEEQFPDDDRPRRAIEAARAFARGEITASSAWSAATSSAASAAWSAASSSAASAAWGAARSAARSARSAATSSAWSAATSAAWSAARSAAESAAWSAATSSAASAAWSAARSSESKWQAETLVRYLKTEDSLEAEK